VSHAEQRQQQRALFPLAERRRAGRGDQHQDIDLEPAIADGFERFAQREIATEKPGGDEHRSQDTGVDIRTHVEHKARHPQHRRGDREDQFAALPERAPVIMFTLAVFTFGVVMTVVIVAGPRDTHAVAVERVAQTLFVQPVPVEFDTHEPGGDF
jgi:hypothetical protein